MGTYISSISFYGCFLLGKSHYIMSFFHICTIAFLGNYYTVFPTVIVYIPAGGVFYLSVLFLHLQVCYLCILTYQILSSFPPSAVPLTETYLTILFPCFGMNSAKADRKFVRLAGHLGASLLEGEDTYSNEEIIWGVEEKGVRGNW